LFHKYISQYLTHELFLSVFTTSHCLVLVFHTDWVVALAKILQQSIELLMNIFGAEMSCVGVGIVLGNYPNVYNVFFSFHWHFAVRSFATAESTIDAPKAVWCRPLWTRQLRHLKIVISLSDNFWWTYWWTYLSQ